MIKIVIPTAGRFNNVLTNIKGQILCVPEKEKEQYKKANDFEIIAHPKLKNLAEKRNWILNKFKGEVFMVDDDMINFQNITKKTDRNLNPEQTNKRIQEIYYQAKCIDAKLFGFSEDPNHLHYNPYKPFMLKGITGGGSYGILKNSDLHFSEKTTACDSHFVTILNIYKNRYSLIDTRFCFQPKDTFKGSGGQSLKRTLETEKRDSLYLRKMFGEIVEMKKPKKGAKQNHQYQRIIKTKW